MDGGMDGWLAGWLVGWFPITVPAVVLRGIVYENNDCLLRPARASGNSHRADVLDCALRIIAQRIVFVLKLKPDVDHDEALGNLRRYDQRARKHDVLSALLVLRSCWLACPTEGLNQASCAILKQEGRGNDTFHGGLEYWPAGV
ncbi:hypothetical protein AXG93_4620s1910 [Marchantia polymorpha subsp. ruderalis]|uniref:Uncharacterized protein n=1 Tax=Marchantia polymorpha subsp. ruderalis TaxID=1480154 RepID=A0A176VZM1_MARPO|nr:hypothetical protein AXG93_4620s1910 [Marchantia polymorpha subsp. ruderalis]